jgi:RNA polymerase sigma factor (sigma-70 family)
LRPEAPTTEQMLSVGSSTDDQVVPQRRAEPDDAELVRRAQLGSAAAFEQLVRAHGPNLYRYLAVRLRNESDALDALQETLTAAWQGLPSLRRPGGFRPWLVGIAAHKATDIVRARGRTSETDVAAAVAADESVLEIREAIDALPERQRHVLLLRYLVQLSEEEVARVLDVRVGTVKSRSARARRALMELLQ